MLQRKIKKIFLKSVAAFPVVILTGARQTGKSTLCKELLKKTHEYVSLEDPDIRKRALEDPRTFLQTHKAPLILDEIQYAPELVSYIQTIVDQKRDKAGQYILTGSQNFLLMQQVSQSLAGRAALLSLYPCSVEEVDGVGKVRSSPEEVADWILSGGYPELRTRPEVDRNTWCASYIRLYLERDVRQVIQVGDLDIFEKFLSLVAARTGQILNMSNLSRDAGVSVPTITRWLSVLRASYQVYFLEPFHANISKRLIKAPKIYFGDTALASFLMGIHDKRLLHSSPFIGPLFETACFLEHIKAASFRTDLSRFSYFRTKEGLEIDLMIESGTKLHAREIKSSRTITSQLAKNLLEAEKLLERGFNKKILAPVERKIVLAHKVEVLPWHQIEW